MSNITSFPKKNWIREASMKRLNMLMLNKAGSFTDGFIKNDINVNDLEKSGLNDSEKHIIEKWVKGQLSGRHCLLGLLEYRLNESEDKSVRSFTSGAIQRPIEFEMLSSTLSLPNDFLCDSGKNQKIHLFVSSSIRSLFSCLINLFIYIGYLYENLFTKPPSVVIKEALQMLATK